ncbi:MAG: tetratricopeptide repeat protein [Flavobacterium sp.]|nr:tetratricopeptide repeat protein [Pedobacter sp.]
MRSTFSLIFFVLLSGSAISQNTYQKMGQKALIDGDFKLAVTHLEKAISTDSNNVNTLYMLGYSYYHATNYKQSVATFNRLISLKPDENSAYYYRGKARNIMATEVKNLSNTEREKLLLASIRDFSKAIQINENDVKLYQNRAIAYRDYGVLKAQKIAKFYDKTKATDAFKSCITDFQKVLTFSPGRKDITSQLDDAKIYLNNIR